MRRLWLIHTTALCVALLAPGCTKTENYDVPVESVTVQPGQLELAVRERRTIVATVLPQNAMNRNVTWDSTSPDIVSVDERGRIRANAPGEADIIVTTEEGDKTAACKIIVRDDFLTHVSISNFPELSGPVTVPFGNDFDNVRAEISGTDWEIIATLNAQTTDDDTILTLPDELPQDKLCKVARDRWNDYTGFWPAEDVSDRETKVAGLGNIVAYKGDIEVGRLYLTSWDGKDPAAKAGAYSVYFHYADRPFTLSGRNLTRPGVNTSIDYDASFEAGWNVYVNVYDAVRGITRTMTDIPDNITLNWVFEDRP